MLVRSPSLDEVVLQDVEAADHLGEDEHLVPPGQQLGQQLVYQHQLPRTLDHGLQLKVPCIWAVALPEAVQDLLLCSWMGMEGEERGSGSGGGGRGGGEE